MKDQVAAEGRESQRVLRLKPGDAAAIYIAEQPGHNATKVRIFYDPAKPPRVEFFPAERDSA